MMGSCVNLAARLMCSCAPGQIIVDERVRAAAGHILALDDKGTVVAKGYTEPVRVFEFVKTLLAPSSPLIALCDATVTVAAAGAAADALGAHAVQTHVVGRHVQMESLKLGLRNYMEGAQGCTAQFHLLEGEESSGKAELAKHIVQYAASQKGAKAIAAKCLPSYTLSDYWLVAQLLEKALDMYAAEEKAAAEAARLKTRRLTRASLTVPDDAAVQHATSVVVDSVQGEPDAPEASVSRSTRFKSWAENHLLHSVNPRGVVQRAMVHGQPMSDILDLIGVVFNENIPNPNPSLERSTKKQKVRAQWRAWTQRASATRLRVLTSLPTHSVNGARRCCSRPCLCVH